MDKVEPITMPPNRETLKTLKESIQAVYERNDVTLGLFNGFHSSISTEIETTSFPANRARDDGDGEDTLCYPCSFGEGGHFWSRNQHATDLLMPHHHVARHPVKNEDSCNSAVNSSVYLLESESDGFVVIQPVQRRPNSLEMVPEKESAELEFEDETNSEYNDYDENTKSSSRGLSYSDSNTSSSTISLLTGIDMNSCKGTEDAILSAHEWWVSDDYYENDGV